MAPGTGLALPLGMLRDWQRYAPAGAALVLHGIVAVVMIAMLPAQSLATIAPPPRPPESVLKVELVAAAAEPSPPPEGRRPAPPDLKKAPPHPEPSLAPVTDAPVAAGDDPKKKKQQALNGPPVQPGGAEDQQGGVFLGDGSALSGVPLGLRSLYEKDSCETLQSVLAKNCKDAWTTKLARADASVEPSILDLQAMYPGLSVSDIVGFHMGGAAQPKHSPMLQDGFNPDPTGAALGGITSVGGQLPHWRADTRGGH